MKSTRHPFLAALGGLVLTTMSALHGQISYLPITDDSDSDISSTKTYTHAIDFGNNSASPGGVATINGVVFANGGTGSFPAIGSTSQTVGTGSTNIPSSHAGDTNAQTTGGMLDLVTDMIHGNQGTAVITLTGLTPEQPYKFRLYHRQWGASVGTARGQNIGFDTDGTGGTNISGAEDTGTFELDDASQPDPSFVDGKQVYAYSYDYTLSPGVTTLTVYIEKLENGPYHLYGLTNEEAGPDTNPPVIATLSPPDDGSDVVANTDPVLTFNEDVSLTGSGTITIRNLDDGSGSSDVTIDLSSLPDAGNNVTVSGKDLTILPAADFVAGTHYAIRISGDAIVDQADTPNAFAGILDDTTWNFTIDGTAPGIAGLSPADEATDVYVGTELVLTFDEAVQLTGGGTVTIIEDPAGTPTNTVINLPDASVTLNGLDLTIVPASNLNAGATYAINISSDAVEDVSGNDFAGILDITTWNFATVAPDATAPVISTTDPADDATDVSIFTDLVATFDEDLVLGSGNITIYNVTLGSAAATIDVTDSSQVTLVGNVLTINPAANLDVSTEYAVQMDAGVVRNLNDLPNAAITDTTTWSFTTQAVPIYTWIQGGNPQNWNDPLNWTGGAVPPQAVPGTNLAYSPATSGNISSPSSVNDSNKVTVGSVSWETTFNMHSFGSWNSTATGWFIDSGTSDPATFTFSNGGFMSNYYGTWTLNSDLLLSGTGNGGLEVQTAAGRVIGTGGFIVEAGTLRFSNTHLGEDYPYTGGVTVRNTGVVDVNTTNEALGEGALTVEEGGQVQLAGDNLDNNADLISLVVLSAGANPPTNTTFLTGSPTFVDGFTFDLSSAGTTVGNQWQIATATANYDAAFTVSSTTAGTWTETAGVWSGSENGATYEFDEATGILEVTAGGGGDTTPPNWAATYPQVDTVTPTGATARAQIDEDGTAYFVVVPDGDTAPSAAEVKAGTAAGGGAAAASGSIALTADTENTGAIGGLGAGTAYDVYFVAEDAVPNLQATPVSVDITTPTLYAAWSGGAAFDADDNGDGVDNGLAWLLGAADPDVDATDLLPTVSESGGDLVLTFNCLAVADRGGAVLKIGHSNTLAGWTATADEVPDADGTDTDGDVSYVVDTVSVDPLHKVTATIDSSVAAGGKLFGRLEGSETAP